VISIVKYTEEHKIVWDTFVKGSKNGTFLVLRDYVEYHGDRFVDHSLLFYRKGELIGVMPANEADEELHSHSGLTYGGIITGGKMKSSIMLEAFEALQMYIKELGFVKLKYKTIPHIYHKSPSEEDLYALFNLNAKLYRRDLLSVIQSAKTIAYGKKRKWEVTKSRSKNWSFKRSGNLTLYMLIVSDLLQRKYNASPVHSAEEIHTLANRFPENIKLYTASDAEEEISAGVLIYETDKVAHCQYIGYTDNGKHKGALGALIDYLLTEVYQSKSYFDLGASMGQHGLGINSKLLANKESYGARTIVHDFYELTP
jgi:hypothetical protein